MRFRDNDEMDGLLPNNLLNDVYGFQFTPPDPSSNVQKLFVPRQALAGIEVLAVVGSKVKAAKPKPKPEPQGQISLFEQ
jgi:hypothetical protein